MSTGCGATDSGLDGGEAREALRLPSAFVWSKCGTEAGETLDVILARKERERLASDGVFLWGVGNSLTAGVVELARRCGGSRLSVVFSPMRSAPKVHDAAPAATARWVSGTGANGLPYVVPLGAVVTSRDDPLRPRTRHYALVCRSDRPLTEDAAGDVDASTLRNLRSGSALGASQVSVVVCRSIPQGPPSLYTVRLVAELVEPWFVELTQRST